MEINKLCTDWETQAAEDPEVRQLLQPVVGYFHGLAKYVKDAIIQQLTAMPPERRAEIGLGAIAQADNLWRQLEAQVPNLPIKECDRGCSWCCHLEVKASWLEVETVAFFIKRTFPPAELSLLLDRIRSTAARLEGLDSASRIPYKIPCSMLVDGKCSIHVVKPFACRGYNSASEKECKEGYGVPNSGTPMDPWQTIAYAAFTQGINEALKHHNQPHDMVEFNAGLAKLLTD
jgi:Fe-S-cluster containining protein